MTLELVPNKTNLPVIKMRIAGHWLHFIVDTGAMASLVSPTVVANRMLKQKGIAQTSGMGNGVNRLPVYAAQFNLLDVTVDFVTVSDKFGNNSLGLHDYGVEIHGLIGQDVLGQFSSYTIDNKRQRITFNK